MRISLITPCFNAERYIATMLRSVAAQASDGLSIEHIIMDAGSTDGTLAILERHRHAIARLVSEPDAGPADAINKGFALATGDYIAWLNADDIYAPHALRRAAAALHRSPKAALCFGHCPIVDQDGREIRRSITLFKEFWYPLACLPILQTLNFVSQPATLFRRSAVEAVGPLRTDLEAAWDYEFILRLWRHGGAVRLRRPAMANFRWTPHSISGRRFRRQFDEEYRVAATDAGRWSPQAMLHWMVRWGIITIYKAMRRGDGSKSSSDQK